MPLANAKPVGMVSSAALVVIVEVVEDDVTDAVVELVVDDVVAEVVVVDDVSVQPMRTVKQTKRKRIEVNFFISAPTSPPTRRSA
jgi:hypothetical protein